MNERDDENPKNDVPPAPPAGGLVYGDGRADRVVGGMPFAGANSLNEEKQNDDSNA